MPIDRLKGASSRILKPLAHLGIRTAYDLLFHIPFRYDNFSKIVRIAEVIPGETVTVCGTLGNVENIRTWKKRMIVTEAVISDGTGTLRAVWFHQPFLTKTLHSGRNVSISGKAERDAKGVLFQNPAYELTGRNKLSVHTGRLVPIYRETAGITSRWLRHLIVHALSFVEFVEDPLPGDMIARKNLMPLQTALRTVHFPQTLKEATMARRRLAFEELFFLQLLVKKARAALAREPAPRIPVALPAVKKFVAALPFRLTDAQRWAAWETLKDMEKASPMNRLLEGDVGSGKTVVATVAALDAAEHAFQTAVMAPTEVLAQQHFKTIGALLSPFRHAVGLLSGSSALVHDTEVNADYAVKRDEFLKLIVDRKLAVVVGTHALIGKHVQFPCLGLVILDEQHRFGVAQRARLAKGKNALIPHLLSMTATPIPRTLALTVYGDLDMSILNEMPKMRKKVITKMVLPKERERTYDFVRGQVKSGRQVFVICPRIELATNRTQFTMQEIKAVKKEHERLRSEIFPDLKVVMIHGKMKTKEKDNVMRLFSSGSADILVSTSVIEVGIDVPNASVMIIEGAERFGLAQLHQFRGRVGRGPHQSYCFLFAETDTPEVRIRLGALLASDNGFALAQKDLELRGPGDFLGSHQWGLPDLALASLADTGLIKETREEVERIFTEDPDLREHEKLARYVNEFGKRVHLE